MQTYSIVFLDIDGTLLNSQHQIMPQTKQLLNRLEGRGVPIVLCSARSPGGVETVVKQAELHSPVVCYGGGLILDENRSILWDVGIESGLAIRFKRFVSERYSDLVCSAYLYNVWLVDDPDNPAIVREARISECTPVKGTLELAVQSVPHVHKLLCIGDPKRVLALQNDAAQQFPELVFVRSGATYLEVLPQGSSKRAAVEALQVHYGLGREETVACGDSFVDEDMIRYAGLGVAMGNAPAPVKEAADRVTASNDEEGIYIALKNLKFTKKQATVLVSKQGECQRIIFH